MTNNFNKYSDELNSIFGHLSKFTRFERYNLDSIALGFADFINADGDLYDIADFDKIETAAEGLIEFLGKEKTLLIKARDDPIKSVVRTQANTYKIYYHFIELRSPEGFIVDLDEFKKQGMLFISVDMKLCSKTVLIRAIFLSTTLYSAGSKN